MPRCKDEHPAIRVYTVCDESRYLIVRNVPSLGCENELLKLFGSYGEIEECKPMDGEDCEPFTDVYWVKFLHVSNARFAKRKMDDFIFLGNRLNVSYAPQYESPSDAREKLESRRMEVLKRLNSARSKKSSADILTGTPNMRLHSEAFHESISQKIDARKRVHVESAQFRHMDEPTMSRVSSDKDYFSSASMNATVQLVREKLDKIKSSADDIKEAGATLKKRMDNRRRI